MIEFRAQWLRKSDENRSNELTLQQHLWRDSPTLVVAMGGSPPIGFTGAFAFVVSGPRPTSPRPLLRLWRPVSQIGSKWKGEMKHTKHFVKCWIGVFLFGFDFAKCEATYGYLTPDLWKPTSHCKSPFQAVCGWVPWVQSHSENLGCQEWSDWLSQSQKAQGLNNGTQNGSLKWLDKDAELFLVELVYFFHVFLY